MIYKVLYDENTILFDNQYIDEKDVEYAIYHRFNVRFTETRSSNFIDILTYFLDKGYDFSIIKERDFAPDGLELNPKLIALFTYKEKTNG